MEMEGQGQSMAWDGMGVDSLKIFILVYFDQEQKKLIRDMPLGIGITFTHTHTNTPPRLSQTLKKKFKKKRFSLLQSIKSIGNHSIENHQ